METSGQIDPPARMDADQIAGVPNATHEAARIPNTRETMSVTKIDRGKRLTMKAAG